MIVRNDRIAIFPNPVSANQLHVSFNSKESGRYTLQLVNLTGQVLSEKDVQVVSGGQIVTMNVNSALARGPYLVKVLSNSKKAVFADKVLIE